MNAIGRPSPHSPASSGGRESEGPAEGAAGVGGSEGSEGTNADAQRAATAATPSMQAPVAASPAPLFPPLVPSAADIGGQGVAMIGAASGAELLRRVKHNEAMLAAVNAKLDRLSSLILKVTGGIEAARASLSWVLRDKVVACWVAALHRRSRCRPSARDRSTV